MDRPTAMAMSRWSALALLVACGGGAAQPQPAAPGDREPPPVVPDADTVRPPDPRPLPEVAPGDLPAWPVAGDTDHEVTVRVHAVDADAGSLALLLADPDVPVVAPDPGLRISGRVEAPTLAAARDALVAAEPALTPLYAPPALRGRGRRVDVSFTGASSASVMRLLTDVLGYNLVVAPDAPPVDVVVRVHHAPADALMNAVAAAVGRAVRRESSTAFVLPEAGSIEPDPRLLRIRGATLEVRVSGATAAEALAVLHVVAPHRARSACDVGVPFALRIRNERAGVVLAALALSSGAALDAGDPGGCALPARAAALPPEGSTALAAARTARAAAVLTRSPSGEIESFRSGGDLDITIIGDLVRLRTADQTRDLEPTPATLWRRAGSGPHAAIMMEDARGDGDDGDFAETPLRRRRDQAAASQSGAPPTPAERALEAALSGTLRLAATVIEASRRRALLEEDGGAAFELATRPGTEIEEGRIRFLSGSRSPVELRLRRRAARPQRAPENRVDGVELDDLFRRSRGPADRSTP